jgi:hypothetical protein
MTTTTIMGVTYGTKNSEALCSFTTDELSFGDFNYIDETLYRTPNGEFFLCGVGGAKTQYACACPENTGWYTGSGTRQRIIPLPEEYAADYMNNHDCMDIMEKYLPEYVKQYRRMNAGIYP